MRWREEATHTTWKSVEMCVREQCEKSDWQAKSEVLFVSYLDIFATIDGNNDKIFALIIIFACFVWHVCSTVHVLRTRKTKLSGKCSAGLIPYCS